MIVFREVLFVCCVIISYCLADYILPGSAQWIRSRRKTMETGSLWPSGTIVYTVDDDVAGDVAMNKAISDALGIWRDKTCLRFYHETRENLETSNYADTHRYVRFRKGSRCFSTVGKLDGYGVQDFTVSRSCAYPEIISLEIGHLVGMWQEHRRWDRDNYVNVLWENIKLEDAVRFDIVAEMNLHAPYDMSSLMHYSMEQFSKNGRRTLVPKDPSISFLIGSNNKLSFYDLQTIHSMYQCSRRCSLALICHNGGFLNGDCTCKCPLGVSGLYCTYVRSTKGCGGIVNVLEGQHITSPNYPKKYPNKANCNWLLVAPEGKKITLNFAYMNVEQTKFGSCRDKLQIRYSNIGIEQGPIYCGRSINRTVTSTTHRMFLNFKTNRRGQRKGFRIRISLTDQITCRQHFPCRNGGQCNQVEAIETYQCVCRQGWVGKNCDSMKVDGRLTQWSSWSTCTSRCGIRARYRSCTNPPPSNGGRLCVGKSYESRRCGTGTECDGAFLCDFGSDNNPRECKFSQVKNGRRRGDPLAQFDKLGSLCNASFSFTPQWSMDWTLLSGPTPSSGTGPIRGHTSGEPGDRYLYVEASQARDGDIATMWLKKKNWKFGGHCIQFYYHMYGKNMGILQVLSKFNLKTKVIFEMVGEQGKQWKMASISVYLHGRVELAFRVTRGNAFDSDIAIDDISISRGVCQTAR